MKILFQGDSITDCGRGTGLGQGYPLLISARLGLDAPGEHEFLNFGISGNRVVDVYARIKKDGWNHEPDVFSILIGINDVWHELGGGNGVEADRFYTVLKMLADDTIARFPGIRMIFMEPFTLNTLSPRTGTTSARKLRCAVRRSSALRRKSAGFICRCRRSSTRRVRRVTRPTGCATVSTRHLPVIS